MDTKNKVFVVVGSVALIAAAGIGGGYLFLNKSNSDMGSDAATTSSSTAVDTAPSKTATSSDTSSTGTSSASANNYKDGTYTATSTYHVPHGGSNTIAATVTVSGGKITSVSTKDSYTDRESSMWIGDFESSVSSDANGQGLASYSPSRIGGASLTTAAFSDAIDQIRTKASA